MLNLKISVAMCTYNGSRFLSQQLDSILFQSLLPNQIVIVDDNSQDNTWDIIKKYSCEHNEIEFVIEKNDSNMGYIANFFKALKLADGDIIFLADQDDIWYPTKVLDVVDIFSRYSKVLAVNCAYDLIDKEGKRIVNKLAVPQKNDGKIKEISWRDFILSPRYPGMSLAVKKEILDYLPEIPVDIPRSHDWVLNQTAAYRHGMFYYGKILTSYRQHDSNHVGAIKGGSASQLMENRMKVIRGFFKNHIVLKRIYTNNLAIQKWTDKLLKLDQIRIKNIENRNLVRCVFTYLFNFRNISLRCFMGDMYTILKLEINR